MSLANRFILSLQSYYLTGSALVSYLRGRESHLLFHLTLFHLCADFEHPSALCPRLLPPSP
jgi:hypothetical protein